MSNEAIATRINKDLNCLADTVECSQCGVRVLIGMTPLYCAACGARFSKYEDQTADQTAPQPGPGTHFRASAQESAR